MISKPRIRGGEPVAEIVTFCNTRIAGKPRIRVHKANEIDDADGTDDTDDLRTPETR